MKLVETESFFKSFLLFFLSLGTMITVITYINYKNELEHFDKELLTKMQLCNYSLDCKEFKLEFIPKRSQLTYTLIKGENEVSSLYPVKEGEDFYLKLFYTTKNYHDSIHFLHKKAFINFIVLITTIFIFSILFSLYSLYPLRNALSLTREFVKDILHDFNTPISTIRLNISLLKKDLGENKKLNRVERGIENILLLQENLRDYLHSTTDKKITINLFKLIEERVNLIENNYPKLKYSIEIPNKIILKTEKKSFTRIIDNLLTNSSKYNKANGQIKITYDNSKNNLEISDTGKGIKNPERIFERFYKEHERGMGIGLNIVQKLCIQLEIGIKVDTILNQGTKITLNLKKIK